MYKIDIPETIHRLMGIFYRLGMWSDTNVISLSENCRKLFYFIYFVSFGISIGLGAHSTDDQDESVFLTVLSIIAIVQTYRMWIILWSKNEVLLLVNQIGSHSTDDRETFVRINKTLNVFTKFLRYFLLVVASMSFVCVVLFPATEKHVILNIALPFDSDNNEIAFWVASAFVGVGFFFAAVCAIITKLIWYLMLSVSFEYKILGNQLRKMGISTRTDRKASLAAQQQLFYKDFIAAIQTYDKINRYIGSIVSVAM